MKTMVVSPSQQEFFTELSKLSDLVLALKREEVCSLNAHGRFRLVDKHWPQTEKTETLVAFHPSTSEEPEKTASGEPLVHLHVDWSQIHYCLILTRQLPLIKTEKEIVFATSENPDTRVFWFYAKETTELASLIKKHGTKIKLTPPV
jgi:hypothetical protein